MQGTKTGNNLSDASKSNVTDDSSNKGISTSYFIHPTMLIARQKPTTFPNQETTPPQEIIQERETAERETERETTPHSLATTTRTTQTPSLPISKIIITPKTTIVLIPKVPYVSISLA